MHTNTDKCSSKYMNSTPKNPLAPEMEIYILQLAYNQRLISSLGPHTATQRASMMKCCKMQPQPEVSAITV